MNVLAIYAINEHIADLMAQASAERMVRDAKPKRSLRAIVTSLFATRRPAAAAPAF
jgi:hypothetical protein